MAENFDVKTQTYIIKTMANYGINISPGELMRALEYDRNQYEKGYEEGKNDRPTGTWHQSFWKMPTEREIRLFYYYECDFCKNEVMVERIDGYNYCPHCGADMRGEA